jgi:small conductance mechanosensitive channel
MNFEIAALWSAVQRMIHDVLAALPTLGLALLAFALLAVGGAGMKALAIRLSTKYRRHRNVGLVLGRLAQWIITFIGVLVALSILIPTFKAGDLIQ